MHKILLVEDSVDIRILLRREFAKNPVSAEWNILEAGDGMLDRLRKSELTKNLPVIFLTAKGSMQDVIEGLRLGANDYLIKPFSVAELVERVGNTLERHSLINGDEDDWLARSDSVSARLQVTFHHPNDIPKVIYALSRDVVTTNIKGVKLGLYEALANAVYHGNLELDSSIKDEDDGFEKFEEMADTRVNEEKYQNRQVRVAFEMTGASIKYTVSDDGAGFDWRKLSEKVNDDPLTFSGRGILLTKFYYHNVEWNEKGSEIKMTYSLSPFTTQV